MTINTAAGRTSTNMLRVAKGVQTGGQFAGAYRTEAPIKLGANEGTGALATFTDTDRLLSLAYESAALWRRRYGQDSKS